MSAGRAWFVASPGLARAWLGSYGLEAWRFTGSIAGVYHCHSCGSALNTVQKKVARESGAITESPRTTSYIGIAGNKIRK
jgi:hypothetical protein